ncbi:MAG TPA: endo-alpha-N-acetylgalactosaminidase family protein [Puia sp.]|nr:endo-alpha-N-acetylgalactosaminidase family protein [Puia sp.]
MKLIFPSLISLPWLKSLILFFLMIPAQLLFCQGSRSQSVDLSPDHVFTLENANIKVLLGKDRPVIFKYILKENDAMMLGNLSNSAPAISFYKGAETVMRTLTKITYRSSFSGQAVSYHAEITYENKPAISFELLYTLTAGGLDITFTNVQEQKDFYLLDIQLPDLLTVTTDDPVAKLAIPADAGRLIDVKRASFKNYEYEIDWLNPILAGIAYNTKVAAVMDTRSIENHSIVRVYDRRGVKYGSFSMRLMHRLKEYNLAEFGTVIQASDPKYLLKVQDSCKVEINITGDYDKDGAVSWIDAAKLLREKVNAVPNPYYENKTFVRAFLARKGSTSENLSFRDELERIRQFAVQTDSAACIIYLLGWQYTGHDSGYPSVDKVNESLGGYSELVNLIREAKKLNVNVSFYDNYDDSYPTHPGWDPDVICRDPQGNLMLGGAWDGEQSYLISSYKYAMKSGLNRISYTLKTYPVEKAYFIDVLAGGYHGGRKYDFNPASPAGAQKNFEGKLKIIEAFNRKGLDVATEDFTGFFVGHAGTFGDIVAFDNIYFKGEQQIPLIPLIYHGKTSFGMKVSSPSLYVKTFLYGQRAQSFTNKRRVFTASDYVLDALPKQKLYGKAMKTYERYGDLERVIYENGTVVEANVKADTYSVTLRDGKLIAKNYTSFVPVRKNTYMACSRDGGQLDYPVPEEWTDKGEIRVLKIDKNGNKENVEFELTDGNLQFLSEPGAIYKVVYAQ